MKEFIISDTHFLHNKCAMERGFSSADEMNNFIINDWNAKVSDNDIVYVLGDLSIDSNANKLRPILSKLKGKIILIKGNHDKPNTINKLQEEGLIHEVYDMLYKKIQYNGIYVNIHFCHFPIMHWRKRQHGSYHLHGHMHGMYEGNGKTADCSWEKLKGVKEIQDILAYCDSKEF